jgi:glycosyltransferase involved in cell wall biosynthesis
VGESVRTILEQDYPGPLEVVVVDDRSTRPTRSWNRSARTREPLVGTARRGATRRLVRQEPCLRLRRRGNTWRLAALYRGRRALRTGMLPQGFGVRYQERGTPPHLTLAPEILSRGAFLGNFVATFEFICFPIRQKSQAGISDDARRGLPGGGAVAVIAYTCPRRPVPLLLPLPIPSSTPPRSRATRVLRNEPRVSGALLARL